MLSYSCGERAVGDSGRRGACQHWCSLHHIELGSATATIGDPRCHGCLPTKRSVLYWRDGGIVLVTWAEEAGWKRERRGEGGRGSCLETIADRPILSASRSCCILPHWGPGGSDASAAGRCEARQGTSTRTRTPPSPHKASVQ